MKKDNKKALYESIMTSVAKEVKKALNESVDDYSIAQNFYNKAEEYSQTTEDKCFIAVHWTDENGNIYSEILKRFFESSQDKNLLLNLTNECFDGDIIYGDNFKRTNISYVELVKFSVGKSKLINKTIFRINLSEKGNQYLNKIMEKMHNRH